MQKEQQEQTFFFLPRKQLILPSVTTVGSPTNSISLAQPFSENKHAVCTWRVKHRMKPSPNSCHLLIGAGTFYTLYFAKYKKKCSFKKIDRTWQSCRGEVISTQPFVRERFQYNTCNLKIHAIFQYIHGMCQIKHETILVNKNMIIKQKLITCTCIKFRAIDNIHAGYTIREVISLKPTGIFNEYDVQLKSQPR